MEESFTATMARIGCHLRKGDRVRIAGPWMFQVCRRGARTNPANRGVTDAPPDRRQSVPRTGHLEYYI